MKPAKIRICYIQGVKTVEIVTGQIAHVVTAAEPRLLMREARKWAKANGYKITDIQVI